MPSFAVVAGLVHPRWALCYRWMSSKEERTKAGQYWTRVTRVDWIGVWDLMRCVARRLQDIFVSPVQSGFAHGKGPLGEHASYINYWRRSVAGWSLSLHARRAAGLCSKRFNQVTVGPPTLYRNKLSACRHDCGRAGTIQTHADGMSQTHVARQKRYLTAAPRLHMHTEHGLHTEMTTSITLVELFDYNTIIIHTTTWLYPLLCFKSLFFLQPYQSAIII